MKATFFPKVFLSLTSVTIGFDHQSGQGRQRPAPRNTQGGECDDRPPPHNKLRPKGLHLQGECELQVDEPSQVIAV